MNSTPARSPIRVLTGSVAERRSRVSDEVGAVLGDELRKAGFDVRRHVVVKCELEHITALINNVSVDNEADAIVLAGGAGFGPRDHTVEAIEKICEHRIEGFGEAYRRLLRNDIGVHALLARAGAGVFNKCLVFAMNGRLEDVRLAVEVLVAPVMVDAVDMAYGRAPARREG